MPEETIPEVVSLNKTDVEKRFDEICKSLFTVDNLGAITYFLQNCITYPKNRVGANEFETIILAAKVDGAQELINNLIKKIAK